jgi:hypothetical protein
MTLCDFEGGSCRVCGAPRVNARQVCGSWRPGLGDRVAAGLSAVGITKERVSALVGRDCGCEERQELLNQVGYRLGIGTPPDGGAGQSPDFHDERPGPQSEA